MNNYLFPIITDEERLPFYVKGVGGLENQDNINRPNGYYDFQWLHCTKGKGRLHIDGKEYTIARNSGFFMHPGVPHRYYAIEEPWETHWVVFDGEGAAPLLNSLGFSRYNVFYLDDIRPLDSLISDMFAMSQSKGILSGYRCSAKLYTLLIELKTLVQEMQDKTGGSRLKRLQPVLDYIEANYMKNPTMDELAGVIGVSAQYLCRIFNQVLDTRPFNYMNLIKLQKAKELMVKYPGLPVKDMAERVGYNDASYFCAMFKKYEGVTPVEFRNMTTIRVT